MTGFRVGFVGYKNSGKTHISSKLQDKHPVYKAIGFSDPLYECLYAAAGITVKEIQNKSRRELPDPRLGGKSIQHALNTLGSDWGRGMIYEDIWTNRAFAKAEPGKTNLFDNVRFWNEYDGVRKGSGSVIFGIWNDDVGDDGSYPESFVYDIWQKADFIIDNSGQEFANDVDLMQELHLNIGHISMCAGLGFNPQEIAPSLDRVFTPDKFHHFR